MNPLRLVVVDQHKLFREALTGLLVREPWIRVVAAGGPLEVLPTLCSGAWDILLGDPCDRGSDFLFATALEFRDKGVVALTEGQDPLLLEGALRAGLRPIFPKRVGLQELLEALRKLGQPA